MIESETKTATWNDIGGSYVKLEPDKAKILILIDWNLKFVKKFKDEKTGELKEQLEFSARVLSEDGKPTDKQFTTTSLNAQNGLKKILIDKDPSKPVCLRIKKLGEGKQTIYDIEEQKI